MINIMIFTHSEELSYRLRERERERERERANTYSRLIQPHIFVDESSSSCKGKIVRVDSCVNIDSIITIGIKNVPAS